MKECEVKIAGSFKCEGTVNCLVGGVASRMISLAESVKDIEEASEFAKQNQNCPFILEIVTGIAGCRAQARNEQRLGDIAKLDPSKNLSLNSTRIVGSSIEVGTPKK
jgi:hypothetical protein